MGEGTKTTLELELKLKHERETSRFGFVNYVDAPRVFTT
jgi:hypothetical protein